MFMYLYNHWSAVSRTEVRKLRATRRARTWYAVERRHHSQLVHHALVVIAQRAAAATGARRVQLDVIGEHDDT